MTMYNSFFDIIQQYEYNAIINNIKMGRHEISLVF